MNRPHPTNFMLTASFAVSLLAMSLMVYSLVVAISMALGLHNSVFNLSVPGLFSIAFVVISSIAGTLFNAHQVRSGGSVVARGLGAVQASNRARHPAENTLLQVVAEMAIASHCSRPDVYVLREERSINSFVVSSLNGDFAIVVTQGALDSLVKDELAAIVAHEIAHIVNVDVPANMRLMVFLGGLLKLDQLGRLLISKSAARFSFLKCLGFALRGMGFFGVICSGILRSGISKQREFTADEKSVKFMRQTKPLAEALNKMSQSANCDVALHAHYVGKIRHLCIQEGNGSSRIWLQRFTHPSLETRIRAVDPEFVPRVVDVKGSHVPLQTNLSARSSASNAAVFANEAWTNESAESDQKNEFASRPQPESDSSKNIEISDRAVQTLQDPASCLAIVFAVFLSDSNTDDEGYLSAIAFAYNQSFADSVRHMRTVLSEEIAIERLGILQFVSNQLQKALNPESMRRVLLNLERLLKAHGLFNLMNYSSVQYFRTRMNTEFPMLNKIVGADATFASQRLLKPYDQMGEEFALLLSLVLEATELDARQIDAEYVRLLDCYTDIEYPRRTGKESGIATDLESAYQLLLVQPIAIRESFAQHCLDISALDNSEAGERHSLVQIFSASLGCEGVQTSGIKSANAKRWHKAA